MGFFDFNDTAKAINTHFADQGIASQVESLRELGRKIGQEKVYEKRITKLLARNGIEFDHAPVKKPGFFGRKK